MLRWQCPNRFRVWHQSLIKRYFGGKLIQSIIVNRECKPNRKLMTNPWLYWWLGTCGHHDRDKWHIMNQWTMIWYLNYEVIHAAKWGLIHEAVYFKTAVIILRSWWTNLQFIQMLHQAHNKENIDVLCSIKRKCYYFDEIFVAGCTGSCQNDNFQCSQWRKFRQNDIDVSISMGLLHQLLPHKQGLQCGKVPYGPPSWWRGILVVHSYKPMHVTATPAPRPAPHSDTYRGHC